MKFVVSNSILSKRKDETEGDSGLFIIFYCENHVPACKTRINEKGNFYND